MADRTIEEDAEGYEIPHTLAVHLNEFATFNWTGSGANGVQGEMFVRRLSSQMAAKVKSLGLGNVEPSKMAQTWTWRVKGRKLDILLCVLLHYSGKALIVVPELHKLLELYLGFRKDLEEWRSPWQGKKYPEELKERIQEHSRVVRIEVDKLRLKLADRRGEERPQLMAGPGRPKSGGGGWRGGGARHTMTGGELKAKKRRQRNRKRWKGLS